MATEVVRDMADTIIGNKDTVEAMELDLESNPSAATVIMVDDIPLAGFEKTVEPSNYTLTCESGYSRDVERWMHGDVSPVRTSVSAAPQGDRASPNPPHSLPRALPSPPQQMTPSEYCGLWYIAAALALPFTSLTRNITSDWIPWYQKNSAAGSVWVENIASKLRFNILMAKLEAAFSQAGCLCAHVQCQVRHMAEAQALRDVFAAAMDVVLVAYAIGFLLLSLCQASIIGF